MFNEKSCSIEFLCNGFACIRDTYPDSPNEILALTGWHVSGDVELVNIFLNFNNPLTF
jgi:hypothetical protein